MDGFSQLLDQKIDELRPGSLEIFPKCLGADRCSEHFAELGGDLVDGCLGIVAPKLQDGGIAVLGGGGLVGFQPGPDAIDHGFAPDPIEVFVGSSRVEQVAGRKGLKLPARKWSMMSR